MSFAKRFFWAPPLQEGDFSLSGPEFHHLASVMRLQAGEKITLFDGLGNEAQAEIMCVQKKEALLQIDAPNYKPRLPLRELHLAVAFPKGDRADYLLEKCTELGVTSLTPLQTQRSVVEIKEEKREKLERQIIEACKQCGRNQKMQLHPSVGLKRWLEAYPVEPQSMGVLLSTSVCTKRAEAYTWSRVEKLWATIGPEGGFTNEEEQLAESLGWMAISLGESTLRIETAAVALASAYLINPFDQKL